MDLKFESLQRYNFNVCERHDNGDIFLSHRAGSEIIQHTVKNDTSYSEMLKVDLLNYLDAVAESNIRQGVYERKR